MMTSLPIVNLHEARFECTFGRGCDGVCCHSGRPPLDAEEIERINACLPRIIAELRPAAQKLIAAGGIVSRRRRFGMQLARVVDGWCVFFNDGCVLHKLGAAEGDPFRYKPAVCALFPLQRNAAGQWYVRQWGYARERWDLFCLDPHRSPVPASESLAAEVAFAERCDAEAALAGD